MQIVGLTVPSTQSAITLHALSLSHFMQLCREFSNPEHHCFFFQKTDMGLHCLYTYLLNALSAFVN